MLALTYSILFAATPLLLLIAIFFFMDMLDNRARLKFIIYHDTIKKYDVVTNRFTVRGTTGRYYFLNSGIDCSHKLNQKIQRWVSDWQQNQ